jgi:phosphonate transport system substrate-binding protein
MITRRIAIAAVFAAGAAASIGGAQAQDWKSKYPEINFAVVPAENSAGVMDRWTPFVAHLSSELGVKVNLRIANDYAAVIEGQRAGNIHIAYHGPASFARALVTGVKTTAFAIDVNSDGTKGYYSVFYVRANSPYQKIQDLKGKSLGLVDPNSGSGYNMPLFTLDKLGIDAGQFFGKSVMTGSHENAILALAQGTVDVAVNFWNADDDSNLTRMLAKGMVRDVKGVILKKDDFRIILKSDIIINAPYAYIDSLPEDLKTAISKAFLDVATKNKSAFEKLSDGKNKPYQAATNSDYADTIKLIQFVDDLRKKKS